MKIPTIVLAALACSLTQVQAADKGAASYFKEPSSGGLELTSIGKIAFGPAGMLLVSDPKTTSIVAVDTGDAGPVRKLAKRVDDIEAVLAKAAGVAGVLIIDMAVNPASGSIYFSVTERPGNRPHLLALDPDGTAKVVPLGKASHVRMTLPTSESAQLRNVTDLAWGDDSVIVAGQSSEEFANKIYEIPSPLENGENARFFSAETFHVAHNKWETKAPIQSFIPWEENGDFYIVGAFACTPIAKFPISELESGAKIKGTSVVELGSGNRPRDMFTYKKDGVEWLVTNTQRFQKNLFGPSKYWAARVKMDYLNAASPEDTNENAVRRDVNVPNGPAAKGIEVVETLFGAVMVSQLANEEVIVLRETDSANEEAPHAVELVTLP
ncbi:MAG TPA: hypothetical protein PK529_13135 [Verrucomicrobiales bacterium]|nr:hypothetical protein [Verrucomicrobiales bacterium]